MNKGISILAPAQSPNGTADLPDLVNLARSLPVDKLPDLIGELAKAQALAFSRLLSREPVDQSDELMPVEEGAAAIGCLRNGSIAMQRACLSCGASVDRFGVPSWAYRRTCGGLLGERGRNSAIDPAPS